MIPKDTVCFKCGGEVPSENRAELSIDFRRFKGGYRNYRREETPVFICLDCEKEVMKALHAVIPRKWTHKI